MTTDILTLDYQPAADALAGRVILVTGAGSGLGLAAARAFAAHGATVVLLGRRVRALEAAYDAIVEAGCPQPAIFPLDLASATAAECANLAASIEGSLGGLYGLLHSAGMLGALTPVEHYASDDWTEIITVNLNAAFLLTQACLPLLREQEDARVLFTSADVARRGRAYWGAYAAAKAGVDAFMEVLADEEEARGRVRVASIDPGRARTRIHLAAYPGLAPEAAAAPETLMPAYLRFMCEPGRELHGRRLRIAHASAA